MIHIFHSHRILIPEVHIKLANQYLLQLQLFLEKEKTLLFVTAVIKLCQPPVVVNKQDRLNWTKWLYFLDLRTSLSNWTQTNAKKGKIEEEGERTRIRSIFNLTSLNHFFSSKLHNKKKSKARKRFKKSNRWLKKCRPKLLSLGPPLLIMNGISLRNICIRRFVDGVAIEAIEIRESIIKTHKMQETLVA